MEASDRVSSTHMATSFRVVEYKGKKFVCDYFGDTMLDVALTRNQISLTNQPTLAVCNCCQIGLTQRVVYDHMKMMHEDFKENADFFQTVLERAHVVRIFEQSASPIPPIPELPIYGGMLCGSPNCGRVLSNPPELMRHIRTSHRGNSTLKESPCDYQEVHEATGCVKFQVNDGKSLLHYH